MTVHSIIDRFSALEDEVLMQAMQCRTAEELMVLGAKNNITVSPDEALHLLGAIQQETGAIGDNELHAVTGGMWSRNFGCREHKNVSKHLWGYTCNDCGKSWK